MARRIDVTDPADPRLVDYVGLRDTNLRKSLEAEHGLFIAEGERVIGRALAAGYVPRSVLTTERWLPRLDELVERLPELPCYVAPEAVLAQVAGFHVHRGALTSMHRRPLPDLGSLLAPARTAVVLEDVVDHANVGTIVRTAAGLGVDAAVLSPRCADPLYRRAVKTSMGAVFTLPWTRLTDWRGAIPTLQGNGFHVVALTPDPDAIPVADAVAGHDRVALLLGTEGPGLSERWQRQADQRAGIPMARGVDSLNIAAAAAIACYELIGAVRPVPDRARAGGRTAPRRPGPAS